MRALPRGAARRAAAGASSRSARAPGANFPHYPRDGDRGRRRRAGGVPARAGARGRRRRRPCRSPCSTASPTRCRSQDGSCDAAVACLVLCSVPDQARALAELRRVLKPGGELRFFEHVRGADACAWRAGSASPTAPSGRALFGGCHTARDTRRRDRGGRLRARAPPRPAARLGPGRSCRSRRRRSASRASDERDYCASAASARNTHATSRGLSRSIPASCSMRLTR